MPSTIAPLLQLTDALPDPSLDDLRGLLRQLRHRQHITMLEQVAHEVGPSIYAEIRSQLYESTVFIRRGVIAGLPPGTYEILLRSIVRRRRAEMTRSTVRAG